jgi:hypothetical protein
MQRKLSGYKRQDEKHDIYSPSHFIRLEKVSEMLKEAEEKCFYCRKQMLLEGYKSWSREQWTLDRIDNDFGHNDGNVVLSCLGCNLQRRQRSVDKFKATKQLVLVKVGAEPSQLEGASDFF